MNEHDATEQAFKNGYEKAVREIFEEVEKILTTDGYFAFASVRKYTELKKKYTEDENNDSKEV